VQSLVEKFQRASIPLDVLIGAYEGGDASLAGEASVSDEPVLQTVRTRRGITDATVGVELLGDAIERMIGDAPDAVRGQWHDAKVRLLSETDESRRRIAIRHLTAADYEDDSVVAAALESMLRDDDEIAREMALSIGWHVDPEQRADILQLLLDTLEDCTRRRSSRAAYPMSAIFSMYESARRVPPDDVLRRVGEIVGSTDDSAAFAGATDLESLAISRGALGTAEAWLRGADATLIVLAVSAIASRNAAMPAELCPAMNAAATTVEGATTLPPQVQTWVRNQIRKQLEVCR
jgi:hypothetical protein